MNTQSPIAQYDSLLSSNSFVFLVFFRGHWCPFCMAYIKQLHTLEERITAAGGKIMLLTAEAQEHIPATLSTTGYSGLIFSDPSNSLALELKSRGLIEVAISEKQGYPHGMAQPAILVGRQTTGMNGVVEKEVLEKWAIVPSIMNIGGAKDRPDLVQVWENVQAKLAGKEAVHENYNLQGVSAAIAGFFSWK